MKPIIKIDLERIINNTKSIILELGCGSNKKIKESIGIDKIDFPCVDIVTDLENGLPFFPDNSIDKIYAKSFFEHIENFEKLMKDIVRVLKKGGECHLIVPHFSNPYYYSDYTHKRFFGLYTFYYFSDLKYQLKRKVPNFYTDIRIKIIAQRLIFKSPFKRRKLIKNLIGRFINKNRKWQEFYEENLCFIFPCYEIEIIFTPDK